MRHDLLRMDLPIEPLLRGNVRGVKVGLWECLQDNLEGKRTGKFMFRVVCAKYYGLGYNSFC